MTFLLLSNTLRLFVTVAAIALPIATLLAICLSGKPIPGDRYWRGCLLVSLFMPLYIHLAGWEAGFGLGGWYSTHVAARLSAPPLDQFRGAVFVHAMASVAWLYWIVQLGWSSIPASVREATMLEPNRWRSLIWITVPLLSPALLVGLIYVLMICSTEIIVTDRYQYRTYAEVLYNAFVMTSDFRELPLRIAPLLLIMGGLTACGLLLAYSLVPAIRSQTQRRTSEPSVAIGGNHLPMLIRVAVVAIITTIVLWLPLANLVYQAGIAVQEIDGVRQRYWSLGKLLTIVARSPWRFREELMWTVSLAQLTMVTATSLAALAVWWVGRTRWRSWCLAIVCVVCFVTPGPFLGLGLIWLLNRPNFPWLIWLYDDTLFAPCVALTIRAFPWTVCVLWLGLLMISPSVLEAASIDASRWRRLHRIALPLLGPALMCAAALAIAVAMSDVSATVLVLPPGVTTVSNRIFNLIHYGAEDELAGICLASLAMMTTIALVTRHFYRRMMHWTD